jgi:aminopeptidase N
MSKNVKRLFKSFVPKNYQIELDPDRETMHLRGQVTIRGKKVDRPSQRLTFHQNGLKITSARIIKHDKKGTREIAVKRINHQRTADEVRVHVDEQLFPGEYSVTLSFEGEITRNMEGIYPCFFKQDDEEKKLIATQFESHHAREAFPCIDEPEAKATFDLTVLSPKGEAIIGNTPVKTQSERDGKLVTTFETTPHMSTYLLAFIYGELSYLEKQTKNGVVLRTYATRDNVAHTEFALDAAVRSLEFYSEYFDIPYPLAKCDFVALPDFASGAMENWGCITFREQAMVVDPANTSLPSKQYVAVVVAHELTHQWFGNLVTMRWWTDLWLNEGFASWMEYLATDHLFPEWHMWTQFVVDDQQPAMKSDALENTHPIEVPIHHPDEIRTIFDGISYYKGSSVIQMLAHFLGPKDFRDGLRHYLKKHAYGNTDTVDLWNSLEAVSKKPVKEFMQSWTSQSGYPLVQVEVHGDEFVVEQKPFVVNPKSSKRQPPYAHWLIPLNTGGHDLFTQESLTGKISDSNPETFKLNREQSGFYRTIYDAAHLKHLAKQVQNGELSPLDRLGLLADEFEAAKAGYTTTTDALQLMEAYATEDNCAVWDVMSASIMAIRAAMDDDELRENMKPYVRKLVAPQLKRLGWEEQDGESHFDRLLRPTILGLASGADEPAVVKEALRLFNAMEKSEDVKPDLRSLVYVTAARKGNAKTFDKLLKLHNDSTSSEERVTLAAALTNFKQPELTQRALDLVATDTVRLQDVMYWIAYSFSNRFAKKATWKWMVEHWSWLQENLGADLSFYRMPNYSARAFSDAAFLKEYTEFFASVMQPALERSVKQGVEMITWQSEWKRRDLAALKTFFAQK